MTNQQIEALAGGPLWGQHGGPVMTRREHLYVIAMEECDELSQRFSKALRFGGDEIQLGQAETNRTRVLREFADLLAAMEMLGFTPVVRPDNALRSWDAKKAKVEQYLAYSTECGTLTEDDQS